MPLPAKFAPLDGIVDILVEEIVREIEEGNDPLANDRQAPEADQTARERREVGDRAMSAASKVRSVGN